MKQLWFLSLVMALVWPIAGYANSVDFTNDGGKLTGTNAGLSLGSSILTSINGPSGLLTGNLGSLTFSTGALISGNLQMGGTFAAGGAFAITGNGTDGIPNGAIFNGSFSGPVAWSLITLSNGTHSYMLTGALTGTWFTGQTVEGALVQLTIDVGKGFFNGSAKLASGDVNIIGNRLRIIVTPEPASIGLLGTGLIILGGLIRRKQYGK